MTAEDRRDTPERDEPAQDGADQGDAARNDRPRDESARDDPARENTAQDDAAQDDTAPSGSAQDESARDGQDRDDPGQDAPDREPPESEDPAPAQPATDDAPQTAEAPSEADGTAPSAERTAEERPPPEPSTDPSPSRVWARVAATISVVGEILITLGLLMALFVVYSLWWTNVQANREAKRQSEKVRERWESEGPSGSDRGTGPLDLKEGIGFLHAPSMLDEAILVRKGTNSDALNQGVAGFYEKPTKAAMPWDQSGNFSLAAHRDGHGAKFHNIHKIDEGDPLVFETKNTWYVYQAYATLPKTSKYNVDVLDPIPTESGKKRAGRYITLTTCTPIFTSSHRYIVWGELVRTEQVDADRTPPEELR